MDIEDRIDGLEELEEGDTNQLYLTEDGELIKFFPDFSFPLIVQSLGSLLIGRINYLNARKRIEAEIKLRERLSELDMNYPEIVEQGENWLQVEYIEGEPLSSYLENNPSKSYEKGQEIAETMEKLHRNSVILEDWDLNNILVRDGEMYFIDLEYGRFSDRMIDRRTDPINMLMVLRTLDKEIYAGFVEGFRQKYFLSRTAVTASVPFALGWTTMNFNGEGFINALKSIWKDLTTISR